MMASCSGISEPGLEDGRCLPPAMSGGACDAYTRCPVGERCRDDLCVVNEIDEDMPTDGVFGGVGDDCSSFKQCGRPLYCKSVPGSELGMCDLRPTSPEMCGTSLGNTDPVICDWETSYCGYDDYCHPLPPAGDPCGESKDRGFLFCENGAFCDESEDTCRLWLEAGDSCTTVGTRFYDNSLLFTQCNPEEGAICSCPPDLEECESEERQCFNFIYPGGGCGGPFDVCNYGAECVGGRCVFPS